MKNLIELHGQRGQLWLGKRCDVHCLPARGADTIRSEPDHRHPRAPFTAQPADENPDLAGLRVLAVDDEPDARNLIDRILTGYGAEVETAGSGADALKALAQKKPNVLIMDIGMPNEDGYSFIRKVRQLAPEHGGTVPAIALTAFARLEDRRRAILSGFQMHMAKPVEPTELVAIVASLGKAGR